MEILARPVSWLSAEERPGRRIPLQDAGWPPRPAGGHHIRDPSGRDQARGKLSNRPCVEGIRTLLRLAQARCLEADAGGWTRPQHFRTDASGQSLGTPLLVDKSI